MSVVKSKSVDKPLFPTLDTCNKSFDILGMSDRVEGGCWE